MNGWMNDMILFLADVHIGVKLDKHDMWDALHVGLETWKRMADKHGETCDLIVVCGDLFDHALNVDEMIFASGWISRLCRNGCGVDGGNCPVRILEGTYSHDRYQFEIFMSILNGINGCDVRYYRTWDVEIVCGKRILYLPQQYGDVDYGDAFEHEYDLICGHGPISSANKNVVSGHGNEIVHSVETMGGISRLCVFGHYHEYTDFGNGVYYAGSMLRFRYGENVDKMICMCDNDMHMIAVKQPVAKPYVTVTVDNPDMLRDMLNGDHIDTPHRFIIQTNDVDELKTYRAIMNTTKHNDNIKFMVENVVDECNDPNIDVSNNGVTPKSSSFDDGDMVVEPIVGLIDYIKTKYELDVSDEIHDYEMKIKRDTDGDKT
jgi:DNA repair exonuclease SbcCD nuclease subunit